MSDISSSSCYQPQMLLHFTFQPNGTKTIKDMKEWANYYRTVGKK